MTSDHEQQCWSIARAAERDHGDAATDYARAQAEILAAAGDDENAAIWHGAAALLHDLHAIGRPLGKTARPDAGPP